MCAVCGCGQDEARIEEPHPQHTLAMWHAHADGTSHAHAHDTSHAHSHDTSHAHAHDTSHAHSHDTSHAQAHDDHPHEHAAGAAAARVLQVERNILERNDTIALQNRRTFHAARTLVLNLVSSPGAGKTALLVETLRRLAGRVPVAVIEGDQETSVDADRIRATGTPAIQINTGKGCHLDADQVRTAVTRLSVPEGGILFIENVGNLVCPAGFDLGEAHKVVIASVTEGEDKPLKYSGMFAAASLMVVTKCDLLPHLDFELDALIANARRINPTLGVLKLSAKSTEGMDRWLHWLEAARTLRLATD